MPTQPDLRAQADDDRYLFWSRLTAAQARNGGRPAEVIDRRVRRFFRDLCTAIRPTISLELGAHEARFSAWVKRSFPDARALAVEANPYVYEKHRARLAEKGVEYRHLAAASTNGPLTLTIPTLLGDRTLDIANRMASLSTHRRERGHESVEVEGVRMDDFVAHDASDRIVAWIDVEGASEQVLLGSRELLAQAGAVYIEVEDFRKWHGQWLHLDVARYFHELGKVPTVRDLQGRHQYNVVYVDAALAAQEEISVRAACVLRPPRNASAS
jgi:FkbM family methyltransferase